MNLLDEESEPQDPQNHPITQEDEEAKRLKAKEVERQQLIDQSPDLDDTNKFFDKNKKHLIIKKIKNRLNNELKPNDEAMEQWIQKEKAVIEQEIKKNE